MKTLCVLQHTEAEYLGLMEDQFEARNIRFHYVRPFVPDAIMPRTAAGYDGLVVLGAGPFGIVSGNLLPSLGPELRLTREFLAHDLPVIGIGLGAAILATAAGGGAAEAPLRFELDDAHRTTPEALAGHLPERFPAIVYMRDRPIPPTDAIILAVDQEQAPVLFQIRGNCLSFYGHPGVKTAMIEDLIMEFEETPANSAEMLARLRQAQGAVNAALNQIMVGLIATTGLMEPG